MLSDLLLLGRRTIEVEAKALTELAATLNENFVSATDVLFSCRGTVILTGMGKSGLVARKWASTFSSTGTKAYFLNPAEAPHGDLGILRKEDILIALSFSGETEELSYVLRHAEDEQLFILAVTGNPDSTLAKRANLVLSVALSEEACPLGLAPTTSSTLMMALGDALAVTLMQRRNFTERDFAKLHPGGALGRRLWLRVENLMHRDGALPLIAPDDALESVLLEMTRKRLGLAVVVLDSKVMGVVTDGDLRRFFQENGQNRKNLLDFQAKDVMTCNPKSIGRQALAVEAREKMEQSAIQHLLVLDSEKLVGVIHLQDLLRAKVL